MLMGTVISFFTGNYKNIFLGLVIGFIVGSVLLVIVSLNYKIVILEESLTKKEVIIKDNLKVISEKKAEIKLQNAQIEVNRVDAEAKLIEATKNSVVTKDRYKVIYKWVEAQKGDTNATSCDNARSFLNSVTW